MSKEKVKLVGKNVAYLSSADEDVFFAWLDKIPSVVKKVGVVEELHIYVDQVSLTENDLRELLALFHRYEIDMEQLNVFLDKDNRSWFFENRETFWHEKVFKDKGIKVRTTSHISH